MQDHVRVGGSFLRSLTWPGQVVGGREFAFAPGWVRRERKRWKARLAQLAEERDKDVCIVVGNGPSLNQIDFSAFEGQDLFISNYAFFDPRLLARAKYLCIVNYLVAEQEADAINNLTGPIKLFPYWLSYCLDGGPDTYFFDARAGEGFSTDAGRWVSWRSTVTFTMLQIAYSLGYRKVLMVGFDHSYVQSADAREGDILRQEEDDENHFQRDYFKGKFWQAASVENMERTYRISRDCYATDGREIVNCSVGGNLETFRRGKLEDELVSEPGETSAGRSVGPKQPTASLGFRVRNIAILMFQFCISGCGLIVGTALLALVALNGQVLGSMIDEVGPLAVIIDILSFAIGFLLVSYLYVRLCHEFERRRR